MTDTLLIVPARGGSRGVPRKNVRPLNGRPLLCHVLDTCRTLPVDVVVSTDDEEIAMVARRAGVDVLMRPPELATDQATLDPVVWHAMTTVEAHYDYVGTVQPTSPYLTAATIRRCLDLVRDGADTALTVRDARGLFWRGPLNAPTERPKMVNRQYLDQVWQQNGACVVSRRHAVTPSSRYGAKVQLVEVHGREALDVDTLEDWAVAEWYGRSLRIVYRVDGGGALGMGHVYRALALRNSRPQHEWTFLMSHDYPDGLELARAAGAAVATAIMGSGVYDLEIREGEQPDNVPGLGQIADTLVSIEDRTSLADFADLAFNDLDGPELHGPQRFQGPRYAILRDEFLTVVRRPIRQRVERVLVTFGGTDPSHLTAKAVEAVREAFPAARVQVVLGPGYTGPAVPASDYVEVTAALGLMSEAMTAADLAVTSCGRTVLELIHCQTPTVAMAQNANEMKHEAASWRYGVTNLGYGREVSRETLVRELINFADAERRQAARRLMAQHDLTHGIERFWELVEGKVREKQRQASREVHCEQ